MAITRDVILCIMSIHCLMMYSGNGYVIKTNNNDGYMSKSDTDTSPQTRVARSTYKISVHHFAIHGLCRHYKGQKYFYQVLKSKLCEMRGMRVANLVITMCKERSHDLNKWVAELFDIDGDGTISYFEKHYYTFRD